MGLMTRTTHVRLVLAIALGLALLAGCAGSQSNKAGGPGARRVVVLTLANYSTDAGEVGGFAANVARLSHGSLRIEVESGWRLGQVAYEYGLIGDVRADKADLGIAGARAWDSVGVRSFRALGAPLLINSYALQDAVLTSGLTARMLKGIGALGLNGLGVLPGPLRYPVGITRPLLGPSDYAGQRIGVQQSLVASSTFRALGAKPAWFAVQAPIGGFGGVEQGIGNIQGDHYAKRVTVTGNVVLWPRPLVVFANRRAFAALTSAQQRILTEAAADDVRAETNVELEQERQSSADLCRAGLVRFVDATAADLAALRRAVKPAYTELDADPENRQQIAQILAMRTAYAPQSPLGCSQVPKVSVSAGPLDGAYKFTITYGDLQAAGADPGELSAGNVGTFTFVFDRGRFAETAENPQTCAWDYGTVTVAGAKISLLYSDGGGTPPSAANSPGERFTLGWSLYRDSLSMRRVPAAISPTPFVAEPWLRVSTTPSRSFLSARCPPPANALPG
jgi:TRAP-type C4-dicarboxylate transport system substrate-binding protein